jgi:hypothetical protein
MYKKIHWIKESIVSIFYIKKAYHNFTKFLNIINYSMWKYILIIEINSIRKYLLALPQIKIINVKYKLFKNYTIDQWK